MGKPPRMAERIEHLSRSAPPECIPWRQCDGRAGIHANDLLVFSRSIPRKFAADPSFGLATIAPAPRLVAPALDPHAAHRPPWSRRISQRQAVRPEPVRPALSVRRVWFGPCRRKRARSSLSSPRHGRLSMRGKSLSPERACASLAWLVSTSLAWPVRNYVREVTEANCGYLDHSQIRSIAPSAIVSSCLRGTRARARRARV
jgi:hypothetical protein